MTDKETSGETDCPICLDKLKKPKLLPCRHTFCMICLEEHHKRSADKDSNVVCPLCRQLCVLPFGGIHQFHTNFFVRDNGDMLSMVLFNYPTCNICDEEIDPDGGWKHKCKTHVRVVTIQDDSDTESSDDDITTNQRQWTMSRILRFPINKRKTHYHASMLSCITLDNAVTISSLCPTPDGNCLIVADCGNVIHNISQDGSKVGEITISPYMTIYDVIYRNEKSLLLLTPQINKIMLYEENQGTSQFTSFNDFRGNDMASLKDGRIVVAGTFTSGWREFGQLLIFSKDGGLLQSLGKLDMSFQPSAVTTSPLKDRICVSDVGRRSGLVLNDKCSKIGEFRVDKRPLFTAVPGENEIKPAGLCCDSTGNIISVDEETSTLFVLSPEGTFRGFVVPEGESNWGCPFLVGYGPSDVLWVGDKTAGRVSIFDMSKYSNVLTIKYDS